MDLSSTPGKKSCPVTWKLDFMTPATHNGTSKRLFSTIYSKLRIGHTEQCSCGSGSQTTEHLQSCPIYEPLRKGIWPDHTPVARKLYGSLRDLRCTATFIEETRVSIWRRRRRSSLQCLHKLGVFTPADSGLVSSDTHAAVTDVQEHLKKKCHNGA